MNFEKVIEWKIKETIKSFKHINMGFDWKWVKKQTLMVDRMCNVLIILFDQIMI